MTNDSAGWSSPRPAHRASTINEPTFPAPPAWTEQGLCAQIDHELFFPEKGGSTKDAKKVCGLCPVAADCLAYALAHHPQYGIWGATSERERRAIRDAA